MSSHRSSSSEVDEFFDAIDHIDDLGSSHDELGENISSGSNTYIGGDNTQRRASSYETIAEEEESAVDSSAAHFQLQQQESWLSARSFHSAISQQQFHDALPVHPISRRIPSLLDVMPDSASVDDTDGLSGIPLNNEQDENINNEGTSCEQIVETGEDSETQQTLVSGKDAKAADDIEQAKDIIPSREVGHESTPSADVVSSWIEDEVEEAEEGGLSLDTTAHEEELLDANIDDKSENGGTGGVETNPEVEANDISVDEHAQVNEHSTETALGGSSLAITNSNDDRPSTPTQSISEAIADYSIIESPKQAANDESTEQYNTPIRQNVSKPRSAISDCNVSDFCGLTSPLEALYLMCPDVLGKYNERENHLEGALTGPQRTSVTNEADPDGQAPISPPSDHEDAREEVRTYGDSDSDDDSSSAASASMAKFRIVDRDTGRTYDVRNVMKEIDEAGTSQAFDTRYSFLPSKSELQSRRTLSLESFNTLQLKENDESEMLRLSLNVGSFDESMSSQSMSQTSSPMAAHKTPNVNNTSVSTKKKSNTLSGIRSAVAKGVGGLKSSHKSKMNRKRTVSGDVMPGNAVHVKSSKSQQQSRTATDLPTGSAFSSSFNPMLLVKTIPKAHNGPAWCSAFSLDGRFLATGGEDGNVCIWAVAPKSTNVHPDCVAPAPPPPPGSPSKASEMDDAEIRGVGTDSPLSTGSDQRSHGVEKAASEEEEEEASAHPLNFIGTGPEVATNLEILSSEPIQRFKDHTADVIDLSWSHTHFLLTASLDSSVRLYHYSKSQCLHLFKHANLVASVAFNPNDDRYFISGGIDKKLRLWSITDGRVRDWAQAPDVITAARFTSDGKYAVAGLFRGQVYFYDADGLKYYTQIACRNRSGKHRMGKKVTGISFVRGERDDWLKAKQNAPSEGGEATLDNQSSLSKLSGVVNEAGNRVARRVSLTFRGGESRAEALRYTERMLVSTNDSRVRLYGLNDFCLIRKYKGHTNYSMQIRARVSESGEFRR